MSFTPVSAVPDLDAVPPCPVCGMPLAETRGELLRYTCGRCRLRPIVTASPLTWRHPVYEREGGAALVSALERALAVIAEQRRSLRLLAGEGWPEWWRLGAMEGAPVATRRVHDFRAYGGVDVAVFPNGDRWRATFTDDNEVIVLMVERESIAATVDAVIAEIGGRPLFDRPGAP